MNWIFTTRNRALPPSALPVSPMLYPTLLIAGISVIIASLLGIAAMTGLLPAPSKSVVTAAPVSKTVTESGAARLEPKTAASSKPAPRTADAKSAAAVAR